MSPTRWASSRAFTWSCLLAMLASSVARAQFYDPTLRALDLGTGDVARSPRLLGMGGLSLVIPDRNTSYSLWDLSGIPVTISADDTTSTLDLRPGTDALSSVHNLGLGRERQDLASRRTASQIEAVYRSRESGGVFGLVGDLSSLRWDRPYSSVVEVRQSLVHPEAMGILGGEIPHYFDHHLRWAAHLRFRGETVEDQYREVVSNAAGEYIDLSGGELRPPGQFVPTNVDVNTTGAGVSTSYALGKRTQIAIGIERENDGIHSTNDQQRSSAEFHEERPYWNGQAAIAGRFGKSLEWGISGIGRLAKSEADWRFTASGGVGGDPLTGRGNMLKRDERSSEMTARARWSAGRATFAGSIHTEASKVIIDPPNPNDPTSLNHFLYAAFFRPNADSLAFPDSVSHDEGRRFAVAYGGGASYRLGRTLVGGEFHWSRDIRSTFQLGPGPRRIGWDVRAGLERPLGAQLKGRVGYAYRWVDEDDFTAGNEYRAQSGSLGLGYEPGGASWTLETAYRLEFRSQDFESAADERQSRQNAALELHWAF